MLEASDGVSNFIYKHLIILNNSSNNIRKRLDISHSVVLNLYAHSSKTKQSGANSQTKANLIKLLTDIE